MILEEVNILLNKGEGTRIEFKECEGDVPSSMYETVVSFLNKEGGTILLGITDEVWKTIKTLPPSIKNRRSRAVQRAIRIFRTAPVPLFQSNKLPLAVGCKPLIIDIMLK